jgi:MoaA/NifB/PqqE/SkfB family radical SAM enzyme
MKLRDKIKSFNTILKVKFLNKRIPLAVRFQVTNRCTLQCKYCNLWRIRTDELSTREIAGIIEELAKLGTKRISFSGGEPLLRADIGQIINHCNKLGIYSEMNSNGTLVAERIEVVKKLDFIKLSLDGPQGVHDALRGDGSYKKVIESADSAYKNRIKFGFACTLTKHNINYLDHILNVAGKYDTIVAFQPLKQIYRGVEDIKDIAPSQIEFKRAVSSLIAKKMSGNRNIRNSLIGLRHIYNWPKYKKIRCWAGRIFCIVNTNGDLYPCDRIDYALQLPNCVAMGVENAMNILPEVYCSGCGFCGALELNYLMYFRFGIIYSIKKIING